jgi:hypothetical protein
MGRRRSYAVRVIVSGALVVTACVFLSEWYHLTQLDRVAGAELEQVRSAYARRDSYGDDLATTVKASSMPPVPAAVDWKSFSSYADAQNRYDVALAALMARVMRSPPLEDESFTVIAELSQAEDELTAARLDYNDEARRFNRRRDTFPAVVVAELFGTRYAEKPYFNPEAVAVVPPAPLVAPTFLASDYDVPGEHPPLTADEITQIRSMLGQVKSCQRAFLRYAYLDGGGIALFFQPHRSVDENPHVLGGSNGYYDTRENTIRPLPDGDFPSLSEEIAKTDCSGHLH